MSTLLLLALGLGWLDTGGGALPAADAPPRADAIAGEWWTQEKDARVEFSKAADGTYRGVLRHIVERRGESRKDIHNDDPKLRGRSLLGIVLIWNLHYVDGEYVDGFVYNPEDGDTYRMKAWLASPRALKVRGFLGVSLFGQTHTWQRYR